MGGSGGKKLLKRGNHIVVDEERPAKARAAMHGLERHRIDRGAAGANFLDGAAIVGHALETSAGQNAFLGHGEDLELE